MKSSTATGLGRFKTSPSCGGVNRLAKGQVGKCEFCGAYISDKV